MQLLVGYAMNTPDHAQAILAVISQIPFGCATSYGEVAKKAGLPGYARYVGYILRNLPEQTRIPWHRVMNAQGAISFPSNSEKYQQQRARLEAEGVSFSPSGKVKLSTYQW
ncbi:MGMT family protein [Alkalimarinus sediminis]|uniref:MGMT family protein n=2 Tax=Alkalimarinus sediminis TaxID=1632866 RepID=A0A9E8HMF1_9ALTE|nr:MGMT family protein [Alkalimarinus sediminis]UZW76787.1 MGMT family protein [Alkalimarinus sediminis]